jgi:glutaredoxin
MAAAAAAADSTCSTASENLAVSSRCCLWRASSGPEDGARVRTKKSFKSYFFRARRKAVRSWWLRPTSNSPSDRKGERAYFEDCLSRQAITIFCRPGDAFCISATQTLFDAGAQDIEVVLVNHSNLPLGLSEERFIQELGFQTGRFNVPVIMLQGTCIGGASDAVLLNRSGKLAGLIKEAEDRYKQSLVDCDRKENSRVDSARHQTSHISSSVAMSMDEGEGPLSSDTQATSPVDAAEVRSGTSSFSSFKSAALYFDAVDAPS